MVFRDQLIRRKTGETAGKIIGWTPPSFDKIYNEQALNGYSSVDSLHTTTRIIRISYNDTYQIITIFGRVLSHVELIVSSIIVLLASQHSRGLHPQHTLYHVTINITIHINLHLLHCFVSSVKLSTLYGAESVSQFTTIPVGPKETYTRFG